MREWTHVLALYQGKDSYRERNYYSQSIHRAAASAGLVRSTMLDRRRTAYRLAGTWRSSRRWCHHADIVAHVTAVNRVFESPTIAQFWNPFTDAGRAALDAMITRQAQIIAYIDDFKLLMIATLVVIPLLVVFKKASDGGGEDHTLVVE
jgi:hypothetical protein